MSRASFRRRTADVGSDELSLRLLPAVAREPNFRLLWYAQIVSEIGDGLSTVSSIVCCSSSRAAPRASPSPTSCKCCRSFCGAGRRVLNDRLSRKRIMIFADWARALLVLGMLLVRTPGAIWFLYVLLVLVTIMWALFEPGRNALVPIIAGPKQRMVANSLSSATWSFNIAIGSALGGVAAAIFGRDTVFVLNALSFVASALLVSRIRVEEPHTGAAPPFRARDLADFTPIVEGIRYVRRDVRTLALMLVKCGLGLMARTGSFCLCWASAFSDEAGRA